MMPQSNVLVNVPLRPEREAELRGLLASMNFVPGRVNPANALVPFEQFSQIHVARFVILDDQTTGDLQVAYGIPAPKYPLSLAFLADFDGPADAFRADLARRAGKGLEHIFSCCEGFTPGMDIAQWMKEREIASATDYVNWLGRSVGQIREEDALREALDTHLQQRPAAFAQKSPREVHAALRAFLQEEIRAGRLALTPPPATPLGWWLRNAAHLIAVPLVLLIFSPLLLLYLPFFAFQLRSREKSDPEIAPRVDPCQEKRLATIEDYDVTNQFTAMGSLKPGLFRRWTLVFLLWLLNWTTRHIYTRGQLARVGTIHFARWVFINERGRLLFASNYDGSLETYMDDFINKVGWGLNLVFSNGVGYPSSRWLVLDGAKNEQKFKYFLRRHELPTDVWYKAYPGLTAFDLKRNTLIREGIEKASLSEAELRQWVALF
ncbi:MAG TPA: hypothetical protein VL991_11130 [Terracidiphilus sp.]|nr:hypothetical protein [Terracidiphilus sp.]